MTGWRPGYCRSIPVLVVALAVLALWGASAQAAVVGLERAGGATAFSSANKSFTASCPAGKNLVGVGADIGHGGGAGQVVMRAVTPNATLTAMTASAVEDENGTTATWSLGSTAICADPPPGLERIAAQSATNSINKAVTATCPSGKRLLGAGGDIVGAPGQVEMDDIIPNSALTSVSVRGLEDQNGATANWRVGAYAICANPVQGLVRIVAQSATNSVNGKAATATCPAGKQVTGVGGDIVGGAGQVVMDDFIPFPNPPTSVQVLGNEDETGTTASWSVTAYAICANTALRTEADAVPGGAPGSGVATASCPSGMQVTGAGHEMTGSTGEVAIHELTPDPSPPTNVTATAYQDDNGFDGASTMTAYAICATPLPGLTLVPASTISDSNDKSVVAVCPSGKSVVGVGGRVTGGFRLESDPFAAYGEVLMDGLVPNPALTFVTVRASEDENGFAQDWSLTAYAICANPPPGLQLVSATSPADPDFASVTATCPAGKNLLGTGGEIFGSKAKVIDDLRPDNQLRSVTVTGIENEAFISPAWNVKAYAICANT
jgi:hypothetical protein